MSWFGATVAAAAVAAGVVAAATAAATTADFRHNCSHMHATPSTSKQSLGQRMERVFGDGGGTIVHICWLVFSDWQQQENIEAVQISS